MSDTQQADLTAARIRRKNTEDTVDAPVDGTTDPDFVLGPLAPTGGPTTGFLLILKAPSSGAAVPGGADSTFTVTIWVRNPVTKVWGAGEPTAIGYDQAFVTGDIDAAELYVQITDIAVGGDGDIDVHIGEQ